uniref:Uncharacterized protein n=1 Tax=Geospiza parvula TaxID=87175 RepID=A0A8C3M5N7_GEOPR
MHYLLLCALIFLPETPAFPLLPRPESWSSIDLEKGYLDKCFPILPETQSLSTEERIKEMQKFFHLTVTGKLDTETEEMMTMPRCGMPDTGESNICWNSKMGKDTFTLQVSDVSVDDAVRRALMVWSDVTPLQFRKVDTGLADIEIRFAQHGDGSPFDGRGRVLAHAFLPGKSYINLFLVAPHEFGHSLGLTHSNVHGDLMYAYYSYQNPKTFKTSSRGQAKNSEVIR